MRPLVLLCRWGRPQAGLPMNSHSYLCTLFRFPSWTVEGCIQHWGGLLVSLPGNRGENQLQGRQGSLLAVLTQSNACPKFPAWRDHTLCSETTHSACWSLCLTVTGLYSFPGILTRLSSWVGLGASSKSGQVCVWVPLSRWFGGPAPRSLWGFSDHILCLGTTKSYNQIVGTDGSGHPNLKGQTRFCVQKDFVWGPKSDRSSHCWVLWSDSATVQFCRRAELLVWLLLGCCG